MAQQHKERDIQQLFSMLMDAYGPQGWWPADSPFEVMLGAVLTQATSWRNVQYAIENLRAENLLTPEALGRLSLAQLSALIRPSGFHQQKAARLLGLVTYIEKKGGLGRIFSLPTHTLREELLALPGIGPETADVIILYAAGRAVFVVDGYTKRILHRLAILPSDGVRYEQVARLFTDHLPADVALYREFHALLVRHAKEHCRIRPLCTGCPLGTTCSYAPSPPGAGKEPRRGGWV